MNRPDMEAKSHSLPNFDELTLASFDAPVRGEALKEMPYPMRKKFVSNLVQSALIQGIRDPYEIRLWLGLTKFSLKAIKNYRDEAMNQWKKNTENLDEVIQVERSIQVKRAWENIRKCEEMFRDSKSVGDKVRVKQLELQYMQYIAKLNFLEERSDGGSGPTFNVIGYAVQNKEAPDA